MSSCERFPTARSPSLVSNPYTSYLRQLSFDVHNFTDEEYRPYTSRCCFTNGLGFVIKNSFCFEHYHNYGNCPSNTFFNCSGLPLIWSTEYEDLNVLPFQKNNQPVRRSFFQGSIIEQILRGAALEKEKELGAHYFFW